LISQSRGLGDVYKRQDVTGLTSFAPATPLTLVLTHKDGSTDTIKANHTYNQQQIEWFKAGGALNIIRKQVAG
jgi:aconitate hydratase